jgi:hypothetical protein
VAIRRFVGTSGCGALGWGRSGRFVVLAWHAPEVGATWLVPRSRAALTSPGALRQAPARGGCAPPRPISLARTSAPIPVGHGAESTLPRRHGAADLHVGELEVQDTSPHAS